MGLIDGLLSPTEASKVLRVTYRTLTKWRTADIGPTWYEVGGRIYYSQSDLEAWVGTGRHEPKGNGQRG